MPPMSQSDVKAFLEQDRHAILATNGPDGVPQLTPVWFLFEEETLYVSVQASTVKVRNLRRDPSVSVCIDGGRGDTRYVVIYGEARLIEPGQPAQQQMRRRIIRKYHQSQEAADRYYERMADRPAVLIVIEPQRLLSQDLN